MRNTILSKNRLPEHVPRRRLVVRPLQWELTNYEFGALIYFTYFLLFYFTLLQHLFKRFWIKFIHCRREKKRTLDKGQRDSVSFRWLVPRSPSKTRANS